MFCFSLVLGICGTAGALWIDGRLFLFEFKILYSADPETYAIVSKLMSRRSQCASRWLGLRHRSRDKNLNSMSFTQIYIQ